jgi:hypothetical protein
MRIATLMLIAAACNSGGVPGTGSMDPAQKTYCGASSTDTVMVAATSQYVLLVHGDGSFQSIASFSDGGETQISTSPTWVGVEHGTASGSWIALFDRAGSKQWERQATPGKSLGGLLADGTLIVDDGAASTVEKMDANSDDVIATGWTTRWISNDWILLESSSAAPAYQWLHPASGETAMLPSGWVYESAGVFVKDPGIVALFDPGAVTPSASLSLVEEAVLTTFNFSDGGADFLFGAYYSASDSSADFVWRVPRDLSAATKIQLGGKVGLPTLDRSGVLFGISQVSDGWQPSWSQNDGTSFSLIGAQVSSEFGGTISVSGKTAAIAIDEGHTYVELPDVQIFHDHETQPQTLRASQHLFTGLTLSPDGECAAYYEQDSGNWQLVVRDLSKQSEARPGTPVSEEFFENLHIAWW